MTIDLLTYTANNIVVSTGAKQAIFNMLTALLDDNDEVIVVAPYWVSYTDMAILCGGTPVIVDTGIEQRFKLKPEQLKAAITDRTKLLMLNSPNNPTGIAYTIEELAELGKVLQEHPDIFVVTDDIYEHIRWTGKQFCNIVNACSNLQDRTIVINGVSKAYAMTGWRIGFSASNEVLAGAMRKIQSQTTSNPNSIAQAATVAALDGPQETIQAMTVEFQKRHDFVVSQLNNINGVHCLEADGAFYAFADFREIINAMDNVEDDVALSQYILNEAEVAAVPGSAFGGDGHIRFSYATDMDTLEEAMGRLQKLFR